MADPRWEQLASTLLHHSTRIKAGEVLLIECFDLEDNTLPKLLVRQAARIGAIPVVDSKQNAILRELLLSCSKAQLDLWANFESFRMDHVDCYIGLRGSRNISELVDVPAEKMNLFNEHFVKPVHFDRRVKSTRWCVLRLPGPAMAQQAGMSTEAFLSHYFDACNVDYAKLGRALEPLVRLMGQTKHVQIKGPETDLEFSLGEIPVISCHGRRNIPDGEVFTAPIRESVEGVVTFNTPTIYQGAAFDGIRLKFQHGQIVEADCETGDRARLQRIFQADEGASFVGEWSLGCNPCLKSPIRDILFDEKIAGSFHLTPGNAYDEADNGNRSSIHWDLVQIQTPAYGGGSIVFDGKPVRVDGRFTDPQFSALDPD